MTNVVQESPSHFVHSYDNMRRFSSYWTQIEQITAATPTDGSILEVGVGTGLTSWYLEKRGFRVASLDHDPELNPTVAADLLALPFADDSFDTVAAFQVLEHLPFQSFLPALKEFYRVSRGMVIISVPNRRAEFALAITLSRLRIKKIWSLPRPGRRSVLVKGKHFWEIGVQGYPESRILATLEQSGLQLQQHFRLFEFPFHHFFVLSKSRTGDNNG